MTDTATMQMDFIAKDLNDRAQQAEQPMRQQLAGTSLREARGAYMQMSSGETKADGLPILTLVGGEKTDQTDNLHPAEIQVADGTP